MTTLSFPVTHRRNPAFGKWKEQLLARVEEFQGDSVQVFMSDCLLNIGWTQWHATDLIRDCGENPAPLIFLPALKDFTCMIEKLMESGEKYLVTSTIIMFFLKDKNKK